MASSMEYCIVVRRTLVAYMFKKVQKLSMKSLMQTESGKLVSIVSADLFLIERTLAMTVTVSSSSVVCLFSLGLISYLYSWEYALITFGFMMLTLVMQILFSKYMKNLKMREANLTD